MAGEDRALKSVERALYPLELAVDAERIDELTVRFVDGKLRDIYIDEKFYTMLDGSWFTPCRTR